MADEPPTCDDCGEHHDRHSDCTDKRSRCTICDDDFNCDCWGL